MPSPFPGMDPYLEAAGLWPSLHHCLLTGLMDVLTPAVRPRYWVAVEERVYDIVPEDLVVVGVPDVGLVDTGANELPPQGGTAVLTRPVDVEVPIPETVRERYLEIRDPRSGEVITVIEVLSPANKRKGPGRDRYLEKRQQVLSSHTNLIEIDLLRQGERMPVLRAPDRYDYSVLVVRPGRPRHAHLYPTQLRDPLPTLPVPLRPGEAEVPVNVGAVFGGAYDRGGFDLIVDYAQPAEPPLAPEDAPWVETLLREKGLR